MDNEATPGTNLLLELERNACAVKPRRVLERRKHYRRFLETPVRFMTDDGGEFDGCLLDISLSGLKIRSETPPAIQQDIVLYINRIGRFEGRVVRCEGTEFALEMRMSDQKLLRLEEAIQQFLEEEAQDAAYPERRGDISDRRAHSRCIPCIDEIEARTSGGNQFKCFIASISLDGVEIVTKAKLTVGQSIIVGNVDGVVMRKTERGYAIRRVD